MSLGFEMLSKVLPSIDFDRFFLLLLPCCVFPPLLHYCMEDAKEEEEEEEDFDINNNNNDNDNNNA